MDELDLIEGLSSEKTAGVKDQVTGAAKAVANWVKTHPHELAGMGIGGGLAGVGAYLASRPGKSGLSAEQRLSRAIDKKVPKDSDGFLAGLGGIASKTHKEVADLAAKHPKAMALANMPMGAALGRTIANKFKEGSAMHKEAADFPMGSKGLKLNVGKRVAQEAGKSINSKLFGSAKASNLAGKAKSVSAGTNREIAERVADRVGQGVGKAVKHPIDTAKMVASKAKAVGSRVADKASNVADKAKGLFSSFAKGFGKVSSAELFEEVDQWGRELAHEEVETQERLYAATEKVAWAKDVGHFVGSVGKAINKSTPLQRTVAGAGLGLAKNLITSDDHSAASMAGDIGGGALVGRYAAKPGVKALSGVGKGRTGKKVKGHLGDFGSGVRSGLKGDE